MMIEVSEVCLLDSSFKTTPLFPFATQTHRDKRKDINENPPGDSLALSVDMLIVVFGFF